MSFKRSTKSINGTHLRCILSEKTVKPELLEGRHGKAERNCDPDKGYDWQFVFEHDSGFVITLYDRWGRPRVGSGGPEEEIIIFLSWLAEELGCSTEALCVSTLGC